MTRGPARFWIVAVLVAAGFYLAACGTAAFFQRRLIYFPDTTRSAPPAGFQALSLASDDQHIVAWWRAPSRPGAGVVIYFHGNGGNLATRADRLRALADAGFGVLGIDYRGYGGSTGFATEPGLRADALAAYAFAHGQSPASRIALVGESLGSGVATRLATERPVAGILYDSPFASMVRMAEMRAPFLPSSMLLTDRYESETRIAEVHAPILILHCQDDFAIPIGEGRRLFAAAHEPRRFVAVPGCGHVQTWRPDTMPLILSTLHGWLDPPA